MRNVTLLFVASVVSAFSIANAIAQTCSNDNKSSLLSCASNSVIACRNLFPACAEPAQAITVQDVLTATSDRCCTITGSQKLKRQRACIGAVQNRYLRGQIGSDRTLKPFLREVRRQLQIFRKAGCSTGSN